MKTRAFIKRLMNVMAERNLPTPSSRWIPSQVSRSYGLLMWGDLSLDIAPDFMSCFKVTISLGERVVSEIVETPNQAADFLQRNVMFREHVLGLQQPFLFWEGSYVELHEGFDEYWSDGILLAVRQDGSQVVFKLVTVTRQEQEQEVTDFLRSSNRWPWGEVEHTMNILFN